MTSERAKAMDNLIAQDADLIEFMASDAACYLYPDEGQKAERATYTRGCAEQAAELAKFKALAETLATDLRECARALQSLRQNPGTGADGRLWQRIKEITDAAHAAVAQYKETRDAS